MQFQPRSLGVRAGFPLLAAITWAFLPAAQSPRDADERWYKGNLHTHTINSDGDSSPDAVARWYKEHRYNFLVLTDHDFRTNPDGLNSIFAAAERFLLIAGEEVTSGFEEKPLHVNGLNVRQTVPPVFGGGVVDTIQKNVDAILEAGGVPSLNHPNYRWAVTPGELGQVRGLHLFEVYNGHPKTHDTGGGGVPGLEAMWDAVLSSGNRVYGIAVDDAHRFKVFGPNYSNPGRGWVSVKARELSTEAILDGIEKGRFYSSTGVVLDNVEWLSDGLRIDIVPPPRDEDNEEDDTKYTTDFIGEGGKLLARSMDASAAYTLKPGDAYVRAKVTSSRGELAWVQPVFAR